jgi:signal transduction histidine kinase
VSLICVSADGIGYLVARQQVGTGFILRSLLLPLTTLLAGYLREQAQHAEAALHERLRQSNLLNDVTGSLGASLELDSVLQAAVAAAARLFGSRAATLRASTGTFTVGNPDQSQTDRGATVMELVGYETWLATITVEQTEVAMHPDIVASFVERVTLAIENAWLYRNLATAHQDLLSVDEMKTNFLANVSHELRTPLTSIRSFSELLLDYQHEPPLQQEFLRIISSESERLTRLVNDVLDISRIEAGHMNWHMDSVDVSTVLQGLATTFRPQMGIAKLDFDVELAANLPLVHGDPDRLNQLFENLLSNAMKFTPEGGTVVLRAQALHNEVHVSVRDTGVGIATADQARIFEKFQQLGDTLTDKPRGAGLGLPICRDIINHHGGRLWVQSAPGAGSTFSVALPVHADATVLVTAA